MSTLYLDVVHFISFDNVCAFFGQFRLSGQYRTFYSIFVCFNYKARQIDSAITQNKTWATLKYKHGKQSKLGKHGKPNTKIHQSPDLIDTQFNRIRFNRIIFCDLKTRFNRTDSI